MGINETLGKSLPRDAFLKSLRGTLSYHWVNEIQLRTTVTWIPWKDPCSNIAYLLRSSPCWWCWLWTQGGWAVLFPPLMEGQRSAFSLSEKLSDGGRICHQMTFGLDFSATCLHLPQSSCAHNSSWHLNPDSSTRFCQDCCHWVPVALEKMQLTRYSPRSWWQFPQDLQVSGLVRSPHSLPSLWSAVALQNCPKDGSLKEMNMFS